MVIGFALLAFLAGDLINGGSTLLRARELNAFSVNKETVQIQDYNSRVEQMAEQFRAQGQTLNEAQTVQLRNQVFSTMVAEQILHEEANKIGLAVTPEETFELVQGDYISPVILNNPMFLNPETGTFNKAELLNFLKTLNDKSASYTPEVQAQMDQLKSMWMETEKQVRNYSLSEKYTNLIAKAIVANSLEVKRAHAADQTMSNLVYVGQNARLVSDSLVNVTDADLKAYYDAHKELVRTQPGAVVDLIYANITPSDADYQKAKDDAGAAREELLNGEDPSLVLGEYSDIPYNNVYLSLAELQGSGLPHPVQEFVTNATVGQVSDVMAEGDNYLVAMLAGKKNSPESLHVRHIVLAPKGSYKGQVDADSLLQVLQATPAAFAAAAEEHSLDRNSSQKGGEIGWLNEAQATQYIGADFADAIYKATVGRPFEFTSKFGEHLILVEEARANVDKYNVALAVNQVTASTDTQTRVYNDLSHFLANNKDVEGIDTAAINAGYQVLDDLRVMSAQPMVANNIPESREVIRWVMNNKKGEVSSIMEAGDKYVVARVVDKFAEGYADLKSVENQLRPIVASEKKTDYLYDQLTAAGYSSLQAYADACGQPIDTLNYVKYSTPQLEAIGSEPALNAVAAFAPLNTPTPVKGNGSVYLVNVLSRESDPTAAAEDATKVELTNSRRGLVRMRALDVVMSKADIKDLRWKFF